MEYNPSPKLAVFISGEGTNLQALIDYRKRRKLAAKLALVVSSSPTAPGLMRAEQESIPTFIYEEKKFSSNAEAVNTLMAKLREFEINYIALAGYLKLIPPEVVAAFPDRILNIHPALLPKYGGKGMYGMRVHEAVIAAHDKESGLTVHLVDDKYDHGRILKQIRVPVHKDDTPELLQQRIQKEEHKHYPIVISRFIEGKI
jgi:phosphoribosylglycinamide formyltransferase-1